MQPLAAGRLWETGKAVGLQPLPHLLRRLDHAQEIHPFGGIEVEHQPVRHVGRRGPRAPGVQLDRGQLRQRQQPAFVVDAQERLGLAGDRDAADQRRLPGHGMALEEALALDPVGRPQHRKRPARHMRQDAPGIL